MAAETKEQKAALRKLMGTFESKPTFTVAEIGQIGAIDLGVAIGSDDLVCIVDSNEKVVAFAHEGSAHALIEVLNGDEPTTA